MVNSGQNNLTGIAEIQNLDQLGISGQKSYNIWQWAIERRTYVVMDFFVEYDKI